MRNYIDACVVVSIDTDKCVIVNIGLGACVIVSIGITQLRYEYLSRLYI